MDQLSEMTNMSLNIVSAGNIKVRGKQYQS